MHYLVAGSVLVAGSTHHRGAFVPALSICQKAPFDSKAPAPQTWQRLSRLADVHERIQLLLKT